MNPVETIKKCAATNSASEKVRILQNNDSSELRYILQMATSPFEVYRIKEFDFAEPSGHSDFTYSFDKIKFCLHHLKIGNVKGTFKEFVYEISKHLNSEQQEALTWILKKDLRAGMGFKIVNKAFKDLVPEFSVQLAQKIKFDKINYPAIAEIKENGRRNIAIVLGGEVKHFSRSGKEHINYHVFDQELLKIARGHDVIFDGEVRGTGGTNKHDRKLANKQAMRKDNVDMEGQIYVVWDMMPVGAWKLKSCDKPLVERQALLKMSFDEFRQYTDMEYFKVRRSKTYIVKSEEELRKLYKKVLKKGREGLMVKDPNSGYEFKRSWSWMKMKPEESEDLVIVDVVEGTKSREGMLGALVVDYKGKTVHCGLGKGITIDYCRELWEQKDSLIGKVAEIVHAGETTEGSLEVPKFIGIRDDKEAGEC